MEVTVGARRRRVSSNIATEGERYWRVIRRDREGRRLFGFSFEGRGELGWECLRGCSASWC